VLGSEEPWRSARDVVRTARTTGAATSAQAHDAARRRTWDLAAVRSEAADDGAGRIILAIADISGIVELQETIRRNETLSAMGSLVAGVAHEVRNPLFSITATLDALHAEIGDDRRYAEYWPLLGSQVGRLKQLTRDLLDYGKPQRLRLAPTHLKEVLHRSARACALLARQGEVVLIVETPEELPVLDLDSGRVEQVFENLIANAIQHSPREGVVRIRAERVSSEAGAEIRCSVADQGPGVAEQDLCHVFEPFFSRRKGGTGLGLAIVQRIVDDHGGRVLAANRRRGGATFTVCLPLPARRRCRLPRTVLLVDDEHDIRVPLRRFLEGKGFRVCEAESVAGAAEAFKRERPDAAIVDFSLPDGRRRRAAAQPALRGPHAARDHADRARHHRPGRARDAGGGRAVLHQAGGAAHAAGGARARAREPAQPPGLSAAQVAGGAARRGSVRGRERGDQAAPGSGAARARVVRARADPGQRPAPARACSRAGCTRTGRAPTIRSWT
jgi:signal transduction histidine kinase